MTNCFASSCEYSEDSDKMIFDKTIVSIGDSLTWGGSGDKLRCLLRDYGMKYDFAGRHFDSFGFRHEGEGGNTTMQVMERIQKIPVADAYFLLIGTNDAVMPAMQTVENIISIAIGLREKNDKSIIYISTLLPRNDQYNSRNQEVNSILNYFQDTHRWFKNCFILDAGNDLFKDPYWMEYFPDNIHPNEKGYVVYTNLVIQELPKFQIS